MSGYSRSALAAFLLVCSLAVRTHSQVEAREFKSEAAKVADMKPKNPASPGGTGPASLRPGQEPKPTTPFSHTSVKLGDNKRGLTTLSRNPFPPATDLGSSAPAFSHNVLDNLNFDLLHVPDSDQTYNLNSASNLKPAPRLKFNLNAISDLSFKLADTKEITETGPGHESSHGHAESHEEPGHHHPDPCEKLRGPDKETCEKGGKKSQAKVQTVR